MTIQVDERYSSIPAPAWAQRSEKSEHMVGDHLLNDHQINDHHIDDYHIDDHLIDNHHIDDHHICDKKQDNHDDHSLLQVITESSLGAWADYIRSWCC